MKNKYNNNWRIIIPNLNLDAPILEGTDSYILKIAVGHFNTTGINKGNICLAAHNRGYKYNYFERIKELEEGDKIIYKIENEIIFFSVISNKVIEETDISVLEHSNDNILTLITCEKDKKEYRRCVVAKKV